MEETYKVEVGVGCSTTSRFAEKHDLARVLSIISIAAKHSDMEYSRLQKPQCYHGSIRRPHGYPMIVSVVGIERAGTK